MKNKTKDGIDITYSTDNEIIFRLFELSFLQFLHSFALSYKIMGTGDAMINARLLLIIDNTIKQSSSFPEDFKEHISEVIGTLMDSDRAFKYLIKEALDTIKNGEVIFRRTEILGCLDEMIKHILAAKIHLETSSLKRWHNVLEKSRQHQESAESEKTSH